MQALNEMRNMMITLANKWQDRIDRVTADEMFATLSADFPSTVGKCPIISCCFFIVM